MPVAQQAVEVFVCEKGLKIWEGEPRKGGVLSFWAREGEHIVRVSHDETSSVLRSMHGEAEVSDGMWRPYAERLT